MTVAEPGSLGILAGSATAGTITTGSPIEYTSQVETMFIRGEKVPWEDKFNRLYQRYRARAGERTP